MAKIKILSGDTATQRLTLSDHGHSWVFKGNNIKWKVDDESNVASIELMPLKPGTTDIFSQLPYKADSDGRKWKAKVKGNAGDFDNCKYSIFWKATDGSQTYEHDPQISVKPTSLAKILIPVIAVIGIVSLGIFFSKLSKKRR